MSIVQKLTENIVERDLQKEGAALLNKWEKTGLLEGLNNEIQRNGMARLLENQAKELLREASTMSGGDVEGFAAKVAVKGLKAYDWRIEDVYIGKFTDTVQICKSRMHIKSVAKRKASAEFTDELLASFD